MTTKLDSFDYRIDDDLFEGILSYLPIEDKFKYESVSKRFQRFVFNKQNVLKISLEDTADSLHIDNLVTDSQMDVSKLSLLLKKLQFITRIEIESRLKNMRDVLNAITDNCNHLNAFRLLFNGVDSETLKRFCRRFGPQLKHMAFGTYILFCLKNLGTVDKNSVKCLFECSPNLLSISYINIDVLNRVFIPKGLVKINGLRLYFYGNKDHIEWFPEKLKALIRLSVLSTFVAKESYDFLNILPKLKSLKQLKIRFVFSINSHLFIKSVETIAKCCLQLESFSFVFSYYSESEIDTNLLFKSLDNFTRLKSLQYIDCVSKESISDLKPLNNCKNLLSLSLKANRGNNDNIFEGIQSTVPQLRSLSVNSDLLTDKSLESIATLKHLRQLEIIGGHQVDITVEAVQKLKDDCPRLQIVSKNFSLDI